MLFCGHSDRHHRSRPSYRRRLCSRLRRRWRWCIRMRPTTSRRRRPRAPTFTTAFGVWLSRTKVAINGYSSQRTSARSKQPAQNCSPNEAEHHQKEIVDEEPRTHHSSDEREPASRRARPERADGPRSTGAEAKNQPAARTRADATKQRSGRRSGR